MVTRQNEDLVALSAALALERRLKSLGLVHVQSAKSIRFWVEAGFGEFHKTKVTYAKRRKGVQEQVISDNLWVDMRLVAFLHWYKERSWAAHFSTEDLLGMDKLDPKGVLQKYNSLLTAGTTGLVLLDRLVALHSERALLKL